MKLITSAFLGLLAFAGSLQAQFYVHDFTVVSDTSNSTEHTGVAATGSLSLDWDNMEVVVSLTNLSGTASYTGGMLTQFGFQDPGLGLSPSTFTYQIFDNANQVIGSSDWDYKYNIQHLWHNGPFEGASAENLGANGDGLKSGYTGVFTYGIGNDLSHLGDYFLDNGMIPDLLLRFQSVELGKCSTNGSDKVRVYFTNTAVPEPSTFGLMGALSLLGLIVWRRLGS